MIEFAFGAAFGAVAVVSYPPLNDLAVRLRDYLYGLLRSA